MKTKDERQGYIYPWFKKTEGSCEFPEFVHLQENGFPNYLALCLPKVKKSSEKKRKKAVLFKIQTDFVL